MKTIAFLGLGAMGSRMAANLIQAGHEVHVWNRNPSRCIPLVEKGATAHASPRKAAQSADIVIAMVRDDMASRAVWLDEDIGAIHGMTRNDVAIECSTLSLSWCAELAEFMASQGLRFLDAPVVGSRPQAEAHQLIHLAGGTPDTLHHVEDILAINAGAVHHIGKPGAGMAMKLAVNALFSIQVAALGEMLGFLTEHGIDSPKASDVLGELPVTSPAAGMAATAIASATYAPLFPIELVHKDLGYAIDAAMSDSSLPLTTNAQALFAQAMQHGWGAENIHAIAKLFNSDVQEKHHV